MLEGSRDGLELFRSSIIEDLTLVRWQNSNSEKGKKSRPKCIQQEQILASGIKKKIC
jgi:hypothetical protein